MPMPKMLEFNFHATLETKTPEQERRSYTRTIQAPSLDDANDIILRTLNLIDYFDQTKTPPAGDPSGNDS